MAETNVAKNFRFALVIAGVDQFLIQKATLPDVEVTEHLHAGDIGQPDVKTPGKKKIGDLVLTKLIGTANTDTWAWEWMNTVNRSLRVAYARYGVLKLMGEDPLVPIALWDLGEIWPKKIKGLELDKTGDGDNAMEEVTFSISQFIRVQLPGA